MAAKIWRVEADYNHDSGDADVDVDWPLSVRVEQKPGLARMVATTVEDHLPEAGAMAAFGVPFALMELFTTAWWMISVVVGSAAALVFFVAFASIEEKRAPHQHEEPMQLAAAPIRWTVKADGAVKVRCAQLLLWCASRFTLTFDTLPKEVCEAFDRLVDVHDDKGLLDAAARDELCNHLYDLLDHDDSWEDALVLLNTVASTDNPATLETARTTLRELREVWQTSRNNALERRKAEILEAKAAEQAQLREVAQAQPDYSAELVELAARRRAMLAEVA